MVLSREDLFALACKSGAGGHAGYETQYHTFDPEALVLFTQAVISEFLAQSGQYVTSDASREAAIKEAVDAALEGERKKHKAVAEGLLKAISLQTSAAEEIAAQALQAIEAERDVDVAVRVEREECAEIAEGYAKHSRAAHQIVEAIRARGRP